MAAGQLSHPVSVFVLVIPSDRLVHIPVRVLLKESIEAAQHAAQTHDWSIVNVITASASSVLQTAVQDAEQRRNTSIAFPHPDQSFQGISPLDRDAETLRDLFDTSGHQ